MNIIKHISKYPKSIVILSVALIVRLALFLIMSPWQSEVEKERLIQADAVEYHQIALNLVQENGFSHQVDPPYKPNIRRTPLYPYFVAIHYALFGIMPFLILLTQLIIGSITCVFTYQVGKLLFNENTALLASGLMAFHLPNVFYSNLLLTETLFTFLFILHSFSLIKFLKDGKLWTLVLSSIAIGLATLCRPISMFFPVISGILIVLFFYKNRRLIISYNMILGAIFILMLFPWLIRNHSITGQFIMTSHQQKALKWKFGANRKIELEHNQNSENHPTIKLEQEEKRTPMHYVISNVSSPFLFFLVPHGNEYLHFFGVPYYSWQRWDIMQRPVAVIKSIINNIDMAQWVFISFGLLWILIMNSTMVYGVIRLWKNRSHPLFWILIVIIFYFVLVTGTAFHARFRIPILPYILLLSSYGMIEFWQRFKVRRISRNTHC